MNLARPFPRDRLFWIITEEGEAHEVAYSPEHQHYTGRETYCRQDGESGSWEPNEILAWCDDHVTAEAWSRRRVPAWVIDMPSGFLRAWLIAVFLPASQAARAELQIW